MVNVAVEAWQLPVTGVADVMIDAVRAFSHGINAVIDGFGTWFEKRRTFAELDALDDRMLADIGLVRSDIGDVVANRAEPVGAVVIAASAFDAQANDADGVVARPRLAA
ncbi:DUF1127 domain-containing protein [Zavarzinia sp. CC-PAN008]|uniref:DUF1127 domain-containing protein n=1 Tax=Zavarzinia sp. CC-PAN008 TaxID=3243332 RepID=UPI003F742754